MKKVVCLILISLNIYFVDAQTVGILKTKSQILKEWQSIESANTKYSSERNENDLNVLRVEEKGKTCEYTFNSDGICFRSNINFHFPKGYSEEYPVHEKFFEDYLISQYKKYGIIETPVTKEERSEIDPYQKKWEFKANKYHGIIVKQFFPGSVNYFCTGLFYSD